MCNCGVKHAELRQPLGSEKPIAIDHQTSMLARQRLNRRAVLKAAAGLSAMAAGGGFAAVRNPARAAENGGTRAGRFTPAMSIDAKGGSDGSSDGYRIFQTDYPFFALGASWSADVGTWPVVDVQVSADGDSWSDTYQMTSDHEDGGRPTREGRLYTPLVFTDAMTWVRFRTDDGDGNEGSVADLAFTYIDASDGPWEHDVSPTTPSSNTSNPDTYVPPRMLNRAAWGADESYRFDASGEIWPEEYSLVHHAIVHHTDTPTFQDPLVAMRSIYYYHTVEKGWGDIGYNYLVDRNGTIYEGRFGGQNVVGGHSYQYAYGGAGICVIGDYQNQFESDAARAGLVQIIAWVIHDLDPHGTREFLDVPNLPTICAHRDVNSTDCPGDMLYSDLPSIRDLVAETLAVGTLNSGVAGGIAIGDRVVVHTDDGSGLNARETGNSSASIVTQLIDGTAARVIDGPTYGDGDNWYQIDWNSGTGWSVARYLIVAPSAPVQGEYAYTAGTNIMFRTSANLRREPGISSSVISEVSRKEWAVVLAGPVAAGDYAWYQLQTQNFGSGWVASSFIGAAEINDHPGGDFNVGDTVESDDSMNVRARPGLAQTVLTTIPAGTGMRITQPPYWVTDYRWYGVQGDFGSGWVVDTMLKA